MTQDWLSTMFLVAGNFTGYLVTGIIAFGKFQRAIDAQFADLSAEFISVRAEMSDKIATARSVTEHDQVLIKDHILLAVGKIEASVRDLEHRVSTLETGQDEWTRALRARTHDLSQEVNRLVLKVDRLERRGPEP